MKSSWDLDEWFFFYCNAVQDILAHKAFFLDSFITVLIQK